jgi:hypothetical protein
MNILFKNERNQIIFFFFRPDNNVSTISMEEKDRFSEIKERLKLFLEHQVTNFRLVYLIYIHTHKIK